jgi:hypothetical protein
VADELSVALVEAGVLVEVLSADCAREAGGVEVAAPRAQTTPLDALVTARAGLRRSGKKRCVTHSIHYVYRSMCV